MQRESRCKLLNSATDGRRRGSIQECVRDGYHAVSFYDDG